MTMKLLFIILQIFMKSSMILPSAIKYYTESIKLNDEYYDAYLSRGFCYDSMGKYQLALRDFNKAISLSQDSAEAWYAKADFEYSLGRFRIVLSVIKKLHD